jgi:hypothetical protein
MGARSSSHVDRIRRELGRGFIDHQPWVAFSVHSIDLDVLTSNSLL